MRKIVTEEVFRDFAYAYHRTDGSNVDSIIQQGFKPGYGDMYGSGWYFTYDLASQLRSSMTHYGTTIVKCKVNMKNVLIFDYTLAKQVFGNTDYTLVDQLVKQYRIYAHEKLVPLQLFSLSKDLDKTFSDATYSADRAMQVFVKHFFSGKKLTLPKIRGIIFTGNHDGNVLISYTVDTAVPHEIAETDYDGDLIGGWTSVLDYKAVNRAAATELALDHFGGKVKQIMIDKFPLSDIDKKFDWFMKATIAGAKVEITNDGQFIWHDGIWKKGEWHGDQWLDGSFERGKWFKGEFLGGQWNYGNFLGGTFGGGDWKDGVWTAGRWTGQGSWNKGDRQLNGPRFQKTTEPPIAENEIRDLIALDVDTLVERLLVFDAAKELHESFTYDSLSPTEQDEMYDVFADSYMKAVGAAWDKNHFLSRAHGWTFYGSSKGGIATRVQRSGMVKLVAAFGGVKNILGAFKEMTSEIGNKPIWGVMTEDLANMLEKLSRNEFKIPPKTFTKMLIPHVKHIFGDAILGVNKNGSISVDTPAGTMEKFFIANKNYYRFMLDQAENHSDKLPIPKIVLKGMIALIKKFI